ncbi:hypothetical protein [Pandoraea sputorum]|uniref:hypothetical protein n=1 Tax=Pandoraea sputorum TaxID=93222 RepID=UPI00123EF7FF|nr:hypothetical protein [Pandoraea sputorum]VVE79450.1 hypothetical protein PSP31120_02239 [Pandoraea sputorum]
MEDVRKSVNFLRSASDQHDRLTKTFEELRAGFARVIEKGDLGVKVEVADSDDSVPWAFVARIFDREVLFTFETKVVTADDVYKASSTTGRARCLAYRQGRPEQSTEVGIIEFDGFEGLWLDGDNDRFEWYRAAPAIFCHILRAAVLADI